VEQARLWASRKLVRNRGPDPSARYSVQQLVRGSAMRLDMVVNLPRNTFGQWSQRIFGQAVDSLLRAARPTGPFVALATNVPATPPLNFFPDPSTAGWTNLFYRVQAE